MAEKITPRNVDYSRWYTDVILQAKLADYSPVKGAMVIRPNGYAIWEMIQQNLDRMFKETGHVNAYFPLLIPESFMKKEAEHVEGFSPECAVVTIGGGQELEEPLYIRPTSETIIWSMYKKWIMSYRDLPILINQWANVLRWELRTRLFLRTSEFLWQEGHTAHATYEEAEQETMLILNLYKKFVEEYLAIPVIAGRKSDAEKFAGALHTYSIEAMMQDKKALQAGTSHNLGQNFAKAFDVKFQDQQGQLQYVWATSWGVSTRLIGALIMTHGDDNGVVIPPRVAQRQIVIVPIWRGEEEKKQVLDYADAVKKELTKEFTVILDDREQYKPGYKFAEWELQGIPLRLEIGPRDVAKNGLVMVRRDLLKKEFIARDGVLQTVRATLDLMQKEMLERARKFQEDNTHQVDDYNQFKKTIEEEGGFINSHWCGSAECEAKIKEDTKATIRNIPFDRKAEKGKCIICGKESEGRVIFAKAY
ncbi:Prolyl-tRNA synthetase [Caldithrix abyssi DSM 13497]|uniref:Proline--tRNA ligase n=1 Tax=Caldithrix abyssi DSM 13497 TaxID=880073 RepID=H1XQ85_CALAY|nr:proline--tRNA ligase [Caldithrix abyssi]APF19503.1 proS prolyl-tRNA synthetase [Caldithrix abyssi DSM 13497]EHO43390.1 Prolyl-tRNA synthetase [Caldithrix abyssi DSM 13497]